MDALVFKKLVIFSPLEEPAKVVELESGLNIVTSQRKDGNDLGKSLIAKSFYHCLGADCKYDDKFDVKSKLFALTFSFENDDYTIYRNGSLFKLFDSDLELLWSTASRHELGELLYGQFGFAIWLPSRQTKETEIAPPAYSYAPYFIDQNCYSGSSYNSFERLGQYADYKGSLIYTFTGAYDEEYFNIRSEKESLEMQSSDLIASIDINKAMSEKVAGELAGLGYSPNMNMLNLDCKEHEDEYKRITEQLGKLRDKLYDLREKKSQIQLALRGTEALEKRLGKQVNNMSGDVCPLCHNFIEDTIAVMVSGCVAQADALLLGDELGKELSETKRRICALESKYRQELDKLNQLKAAMEVLRKADLTALQVEGLNKIDERLAKERRMLEARFDKLDAQLKSVAERLKDYSDSKSKVNEEYIGIISTYVLKLNLQSINLDRIRTVKDRFEADGSNAPLATVAWYFAILKLKEEFNPERPALPLILDSPMNVEADDEKYEAHYGLIFNTFKYQHQSLVTGLGLADSPIIPEGANVIVLDNEKYKLLNNEDYNMVREFLFTCMEQQ